MSAIRVVGAVVSAPSHRKKRGHSRSKSRSYSRSRSRSKKY